MNSQKIKTHLVKSAGDLIFSIAVFFVMTVAVEIIFRITQVPVEESIKMVTVLVLGMFTLFHFKTKWELEERLDAIDQLVIDSHGMNMEMMDWIDDEVEEFTLQDLYDMQEEIKEKIQKIEKEQ